MASREKRGQRYLTSIDRKVKHVDEYGCPDDGAILHSIRLRICAKQPQKAMYDGLGRRQRKKRDGRADGSCNHEWSPLSPRYTAIVTSYAHVWLDQDTSQRSGNPDQCQQRLAHAEG